MNKLQEKTKAKKQTKKRQHDNKDVIDPTEINDKRLLWE